MLVVDVQVWCAAQKAMGVGVLRADRKNGRTVGKDFPRVLVSKMLLSHQGKLLSPELVNKTTFKGARRVDGLFKPGRSN